MAAAVTSPTWTDAEVPDQSGRVAVVTGANTGTGYWTALRLARHGARVVLACRSEQKAARAVEGLRAAVPGGSFEILPLDLADLDSVSTAAAEYRRGHDRLDLLVNSAGIALVPFGLTRDGFESHFGTNFLGHFAFTAGLVEMLLATPQSRVVHVGSIQHHVGRLCFGDPNYRQRRYLGTGAYAQSKLATLTFMLELERKLRRAGAGTVSVGAHPGLGALQLPEDAASSLLRAATEVELAGGTYTGPSGFLGTRGSPGPARLAGRARREPDALRLWELAEKLTGTSFPMLF